METSPSQSSGQGGGLWWSAQTGHPTAVTDGFHQGAHGLTGEMFMETAAKGADIYLPAACQPILRKREAQRGRVCERASERESLVKKSAEGRPILHYEQPLLNNSCTYCQNFC